MTNTFKYSSLCTLLALVSLNSSADDSRAKREAHMQCGPALVQVSAECKTDPEDKDSNICKDFTIELSQKDKKLSENIPYMPIEQKKKLESQNYTFSGTISVTDWAPQRMFCIDDNYILIGYWNGMSDAEKIDGSLSASSSSPIFDLDGNFVNQDKSRELRKKLPTSSHDGTYIDFVYGNN